MKYLLIVSLTYFSSCFLYGQDIDFNVHVEQLIDSSTDTTDEVTMDTHYFFFDRKGNLLGSQNMLKSFFSPGIAENSRLVRNIYSPGGKKTQTEYSYVDTLGYEFNKAFIEYTYLHTKLVGTTTALGQDSLVSWQEIAYDEQGRKKTVGIRNTQYDFEADLIRFDQFDTITYNYDWMSDSKCKLSKSSDVNYELLLYADSAAINKYYEGKLTFELMLKYDDQEKVVAFSCHDYGSTYYSGKDIEIEYNEAGMIVALYYDFKFRSAEFLSIDEQKPSLPHQAVIWNLDTSNLNRKTIAKINREILTEITPFLEEYFQLWPVILK